MIALSNTGSMWDWPNAKAIGWLVGQQCADGGFSSSTSSAPAKTCTDVDATAYAVQALITVHSSAAARAVHWLVTHRNSDGGYGLTTDGKASSNANSTAVAVQALHQATWSVTSGISWLRKHQIGCSGAYSRRGAVRFAGAFNQATALRATTQAGQALALRWLGSITDNNAIDAAPRPLLVHCKIGADRTGVASSLIVMHDGATFDEAVASQMNWRYLHFGHLGKAVEDIFPTYRSYCAANHLPTGGWAEFVDFARNHYDLPANPAMATNTH